MSWWISLNNPKTDEPAIVDKFEDGGIYVMGGSGEADLNVTYNYAKYFDFRSLHSKKGNETTPADNCPP